MIEPYKIYVGRIAPQTTDEVLFSHFSKAGKVVSAKIKPSIAAGRHAGYGHVVMETAKGASEAIRLLHNSILDGSHIVVMRPHNVDMGNRNYVRKRYRYR